MTHNNLSTMTIACLCALASCATSFAQTNTKTTPEIVISANKLNGERGEFSAVSSWSEEPLLQTPAAVSVITRQQMQDLQIRSTTDAVKLDASVSDSYNAVGYAEQFSIRGFALDNARSYRKDGLIIPGDGAIPLENKEQIDILKGLAGLQLGLAAPGGVINYVTKRPSVNPLMSVVFGVSERGTRYVALDVGGKFADKRFGYRINLANENLRSYVKGANGERQLVSAAFDWQISPAALLQLDMDTNQKSQLSQPGFQLINGVSLPVGIDPATMLNNQPWSKPVSTHSSNVGLRFDYQLGRDWRAVVAANLHHFQRDDYAAFPYGCASAELFPGFCANGNYDVYDYQSTNESKQLFASQAFITGTLRSGSLTQSFTAGLATNRRRDYFGDCVYGTMDCYGSMANGTSNIYRPVVLPASTISTGSVMLQRSDAERAAFVQDIIGFGAGVKLHAGLRASRIARDTYSQSALLPNLALVWNPQMNWSVYGAYSQGLEAGGIAPLGTKNVTQQLSPNKSRQVEAGVKADIRADWNVSAAVFAIHKPLEITNAANYFARSGDSVHRGLELSSQGKLTRDLHISASMAALNAEQQGTGDRALDGKRVTNVPKLKSTVGLDYVLPQLDGLHVNGTWQYASDKAFNVDNSVIVPSYHVFNLGLRYGLKVAGSMLTLRAGVDNVANQFYWRDVTPALGGYLFPGAPRTFKATGQLDF